MGPGGKVLSRMAFELMLAAAPIRWADPRTWPWFVYVWLAILLVGLVKPIWRWLEHPFSGGMASPLCDPSGP